MAEFAEDFGGGDAGNEMRDVHIRRIFEDAENQDDEEREERSLQQQDDELGAVADFQDDVAANELQPLL